MASIERKSTMPEHPDNDSTSSPAIALSVVIPAFNEAAIIGRTIGAVHESLADAATRYEILVVDHGSTDGTAALAEAAGARVIAFAQGRSVAHLRNHGVCHALGEVLVFIDADVTLTPAWAAQVHGTIEALNRAPRTITGSEVVCPPGGSWIEHVWFSVSGKDRSHVNSGHLIMRRDFFDELGGFDADLTTAEDFDLSQRAIAAGGRIDPRPELVAYHHGYPSTLRDFFRREVWHGLGSARSLREMTASKVGLVTLAVACSLPLGLSLAFVHAAFAALPLVALLGFATLAALLRPRQRPRHLPAIIGLYVVYFTARVAAVVARVLGLGNLYWKSPAAAPANAREQ